MRDLKAGQSQTRVSPLCTVLPPFSLVVGCRRSVQPLIRSLCAGATNGFQLISDILPGQSGGTIAPSLHLACSTAQKSASKKLSDLTQKELTNACRGLHPWGHSSLLSDTWGRNIHDWIFPAHPVIVTMATKH